MYTGIHTSGPRASTCFFMGSLSHLPQGHLATPGGGPTPPPRHRSAGYTPASQFQHAIYGWLARTGEVETPPTVKAAYPVRICTQRPLTHARCGAELNGPTKWLKQVIYVALDKGRLAKHMMIITHPAAGCHVP